MPTIPHRLPYHTTPAIPQLPYHTYHSREATPERGGYSKAMLFLRSRAPPTPSGTVSYTHLRAHETGAYL
eukprot:3764220-Pyramimonas_sp.AAC.1